MQAGHQLNRPAENGIRPQFTAAELENILINQPGRNSFQQIQSDNADRTDERHSGRPRRNQQLNQVIHHTGAEISQNQTDVHSAPAIAKYLLINAGDQPGSKDTQCTERQLEEDILQPSMGIHARIQIEKEEYRKNQHGNVICQCRKTPRCFHIFLILHIRSSPL